jgi:CheY-like chemotaxis protein
MSLLLQPHDLTALVISLLGRLKAALGERVTFELDIEPELPPAAVDPATLAELILFVAQSLVGSKVEQPTVLTLGLGLRNFDASTLAGNRTQCRLTPGRHLTFQLDCHLEPGSGVNEAPIAPTLMPALPSLELHGAGLLVTELPGRDLSVRILFPIANQLATTQAHSALLATPECRRVLLADDDEAVRLIAARVLQMLKFEVTVATDGEEALRLFEDATEPFRAVMLDIAMPNLDGISAAKEIRKLSPGQAIVFISGDSSEDVVRRLPSGLAAGVIQKPFSAAGIKTTLEQCVTQS